MDNQINNIIDRAKLQLGFVKDSIEELVMYPNNVKKRKKALANILTCGRAVTFTLQNLKNQVDKGIFENWYTTIQNEKLRSELMEAFKNARNNFEKQGKLQTSTSIRIGEININVQELMQNKPKGAVGFFMIDEFGGSGWDIKMPDGTIEQLYMEIDWGMDSVINVNFSNKPLTHNGELIIDPTIEKCSLIYYNTLKEVVDSAIYNFYIKS